MKTFFVLVFGVLLFAASPLVAQETNVSGPGISKSVFKNDKLQKFSDFCLKLDPASLDSILTAREYFMKEFAKDQKNADEAMHVFMRFHGSVRLHYEPQFQAEFETKLEYGPNFEEPEIFLESSTIRQKLKKYGFNFWTSEGFLGLSPDYGFYVDMLKNIESKQKDYFVLQATETQASGDAALYITWEELRKRIIARENFAKTHPDESQESLDLAGIMFNWYLTGMNNTPIYDSVKKPWKLLRELKNSYEVFLSTNTDSSFYPVLKQVYEIHARHNFEITREFVDFLQNKGMSVLDHALTRKKDNTDPSPLPTLE
jgi:hypothetical protein